MNDTWRLALGALQLKDEAFREGGRGPAGLRRAALVVVFVALLAGLGTLVTGLMDAARGQSPEQARDEIMANLEQLETLPGFSGAVREALVLAVDSVLRVESLPTPLPRPLALLIRSVGLWLGRPFALAGSWFAYSLMALVAARLLGGKASLPAMLGATALSNVPYALTLLSFIPFCGAALSAAAWAWSSIIFVKATAAANDMPIARAIAAWAAPAAALVVLWSLLLAAVLAALIVLALAAAGG